MRRSWISTACRLPVATSRFAATRSGSGRSSGGLFYGRVGNGLYVASKQCILEDLYALEAAGGKAEGRPADKGPMAHAMVRIRPEKWNEVAADVPSGLGRVEPRSLFEQPGAALVGGQGGRFDRRWRRGICYTAGRRGPRGSLLLSRRRHLRAFARRASDGVQQAWHGLVAPQGVAPAAESPMGNLLDEFGGVTMALTFLEDGLHAVVTVDRK